MSSAFRIGVLVGIACLCVVGSATALAADVQHEHPDDVDGNDDLEGVEQWLGDRMGEQHVDCADGISIGAFDACDALEGEYPDLLDRYVTVEGDLQSETETAERFNETRSQQREYAALQEEFEATFEEYEAARAAGNDAEARTLARELQRLADRIEALGGELEVNFVELDDATAANLSAAARTTNSSTTEVRTIVLEVESESFETPDINATVGDNASFAEPEAVSGRVTTANKTGIADAEILLTDGTQSVTTTTTANGSYRVLYRPTRTRVGETNLTVQYRPAPADPYLSATATATTDVRSANSTLRIDDSTDRVAFDDPIIVTGEVRAAAVPVPAVDVTVRTGGSALATTRTEPDGSFRAVARTPVTMTPGTRTITVRASGSGRAIGVSRASTTLTVVETATELGVSGTVTDSAIRVSGRLTTDATAEVGTRPITVRIENETLEVRTDPDGRYRVSTEPPADPEAVTVTATYNESGTSLAPSRGEATAEYQVAESQPPSAGAESAVSGLLSRLRSVPAVVWIGAAVVIGVSVAMLTRRFRRRHQEAGTTSDGPSDPASATETITSESGETVASSGETLLETARSKLRTDPQTTVYASYAAVRTLFDTSTDQTHWELYDQQRSAEGDQPDDAFHALTELFERAAFAAEEIDTTQAESALQAAERYLETADTGGSTGGSTD